MTSQAAPLSSPERHRRALAAACLALGLADLTFIDLFALPHTLRPPEELTSPLLPRAHPPLEEVPSPLLPRAQGAGEVGRGRHPSPPSPASQLPPPPSPVIVQLPPPPSAVIAQLPPSPPPPAPEPSAPTRALVLHFDTGEATLNTQSRAAVDALAQRLRQRGSLAISIEGHADARGEASLNQRLSQQRARAVALRLQARGVAPGQLQLAAFGATRPLTDAQDAASLRRNRRVEILLRGGTP
jgi:outer membrane protein OmpA-like peptidoglycan-associated protein